MTWLPVLLSENIELNFCKAKGEREKVLLEWFQPLYYRQKEFYFVFLLFAQVIGPNPSHTNTGMRSTCLIKKASCKWDRTGVEGFLYEARFVVKVNGFVERKWFLFLRLPFIHLSPRFSRWFLLPQERYGKTNKH